MASSPGRVFAFPVYQIDFSAVQAGKRVASSKRRIRWRFGFPNRQALDAGRNGTDCRGEEHEIVIIWSIASGKRQVLMDGREIHYSENRIGILDHSWSTKGNHVLKVVCHAAPPMTATPGFRQYDLLIDGQSFFNMPKVFELGIKQAGTRTPGRIEDYNAEYGGGPPAMYSYPSAAQYGAGYTGGSPDPAVRAPRTPSEEEEDLRKAISASLKESKRHLGEDNKQQPPAPEPTDLMAAPTTDLLGFDSAGGPPALLPDPMASIGQYGGAPPPPQYESYGAPPPQQQYQQPSYGAPAPPQYGGAALPPAYGSQPQTSYLALPSTQPTTAPPAPPQYGYTASPAQPPPSQPYANFSSPSSVSYQSAPPAYSSGLTVDPYAGYNNDDPFAPKPPTHNDISNDILKAYASPTNGYETPKYQPGQPFMNLPGTNGYEDSADPEKLSMNGLAITEKSKPKDALEAALSKLVNLDHIDEPAEEIVQLTLKKKEEEEKKKKDKKSKPLPPAAKGMVGSAATLSQIQDVKPKLPPKELVMKPPPSLFSGDPAMAGALVVHGSSFSTPPPLQPRGVGIVHGQGQYPVNPVLSMNMTQQQQQPQYAPQYPPQQQQYPPQQQQQYPPQQPPMMAAGYGQPPMQYQQQPQGYGYR